MSRTVSMLCMLVLLAGCNAPGMQAGGGAQEGTQDGTRKGAQVGAGEGAGTGTGEERWQRTELYFAIAREGEADDFTIARWRGFLDAEVTTRFPDGLTVLEGYGQWRGPDRARIGRLDSRVLVILHPDDADARARIEAVRRVWKEQTGQQSVLRVTQPADVSF